MESFYEKLGETGRYDSEELKDCIEEVVSKLKKEEATVQKPVMLLGKVQSGKTRTLGEATG